MLLTLIKVRLGYMFSGMFKGRNEKAAKKRKVKKGNVGMIVLFILMFLYVGVIFALAFGTMFYGISTIINAETQWLYFSIAGILSFFLMVLGSVFTAKTQLYESTDNELLLSMPVPQGYIIASRIISLLLLNYLFEAVIAVPAAVVYALVFGFGTIQFILFAAEFLLLGLFSLAVICALAFLLELATRKMRNKNIFTVIFSLLFIGVYFWFYTNIDKVLDYAVENIDGIVSTIKTWIFPAYHLGVSISEVSVVSALVYILCAALPFALVYFLLSKSYIKLATSTKNISRVKYREKKMKVSSPRWALVKKEVKYFFSLPVYILNCGIGLLFAIALSVFAVIKADVIFSVAAELGISENMIYSFIIIGLLFISSMNMISASSISLEGKRLWILKSMPVTSYEIIMSKVFAHLIICLPVIAASGVILWAGLGMEWYMGLLAILIPSLFTMFIAFAGALVNLKLPKLEWVNEAVVIKQSMSTFLTMLCGWGITILVAIPGFVVSFLIPELYLTAICAAFAGLCALLWYITRTCTAKTFMRLGEE